MCDVKRLIRICFVVLMFPISLSPHSSSGTGVIHIPMLMKGLNNQRMRIVQDITLATLLGASVELPTHVYSRKNCHYSIKCSTTFERGPSLWDVYDEKRTLETLKNAGVSVVEQKQEYDSNSTPQTFRTISRLWPNAASHVSRLNQNFAQECLDNSSVCSFGENPIDCCLKLIPNTKESIRLLKSVNDAFQSAHKFKIGASKIISSFKKETKQNVTIAIHWRLDEDFVKSTVHTLTSQKYCEEMLKEIKLVSNRISGGGGLHHNGIVHLLVLGDSNVRKVMNALESCSGGNVFYKLHSKETLLLKDGSDNILTEEQFTDVKGQLDFELGLRSDDFIGTPFSSFSVLIAFSRFHSSNRNSFRTIMANVDVKDHLGKILMIQFPYSHELEAKKAKCASLVNLNSLMLDSLQSCVEEEIRLGVSPQPMNVLIARKTKDKLLHSSAYQALKTRSDKHSKEKRQHRLIKKRN